MDLTVDSGLRQDLSGCGPARIVGLWEGLATEAGILSYR